MKLNDNFEEYEDTDLYDIENETYLDDLTMIREYAKQVQLRYVYPKEMERLLKQHGFSIVHHYGLWDQSALTNSSSLMIYACKKVDVSVHVRMD